MALKHRKKLLAIEWTWLLIGSAVVLAYTVEAWAAPYSPVLWMLGMLALFFAYRFAITLYEINWPEPELTPAETAEAMRRHGGDGISGTVVYALPQMRGRSVPQARDQKRAEAASKLKLPSAAGVFEDDNLDTVFGIVAEDTSPTPALMDGDGPRARAVGRPGLFGVMMYEQEALRPETDDDVTGADVPIPSFAESTLTTLEREKALKYKREQEKQRRPASSAPLNAQQPPSRPKGATPAPMIDELTHVDRPVNLSKVMRDETKLDRKKPDEMALDEMALDEMALDEMALDEMALDEMALDEMALDETTNDTINLDDLILGDQDNLKEETRQSKPPSAHKARGTSSTEESS